jgi:hypothetical protein
MPGKLDPDSETKSLKKRLMGAYDNGAVPQDGPILPSSEELETEYQLLLKRHQQLLPYGYIKLALP